MDLSKFRFSVIYSIDVVCRSKAARFESLADLTPPHYRQRGWSCTERGPSEYGDLSKDWQRGRHRTHCAILSFDDFCEFIEHCGLVTERVKTCGSVGAPGFGFGHVPAVSFNRSDLTTAILTCYVTPIPPEEWFATLEQPFLPGMGDLPLDFTMVERAVWDWFSDGAYSARQREKELNLQLT